MKKAILTSFFALICSFLIVGAASAETYINKTIGANVYGSITLVDTLPEVNMGIGGGMYFDYRFNERFSLMVEGFFTTQDGVGRSAADGSIELIAVPATTFKLYFLNESPKFDPYFGIGVGLYYLTEGRVDDNTGGFGIGAQVEVGVEYHVMENVVAGVGGTFRSIGLVNSLSGPANATVYMPYTLFGRVGYRF